MPNALVTFGLFSDADVDWLADVGRTESLSPGGVLIREGQEPDSLFFVLEGKLGVSASASREGVLALLGPGEVVGELSYVEARPANATVSAVEPTRVLRVPRDVVTAKLAGDDGFAAHFYRAVAVFLAQRLRNTVAGLSGGGARPAVDDLDPTLLDKVALGTARFERLRNRLKG
jgi:CRP-like cAMP-binding protein